MLTCCRGRFVSLSLSLALLGSVPAQKPDRQSAGQQWAELRAEIATANDKYRERSAAAATDADRRKLKDERDVEEAAWRDRCFAIVEAFPKDPVVPACLAHALVFAKLDRFEPSLDLLLKHHLKSEDLEGVMFCLEYPGTPRAVPFLETVSTRAQAAAN